MNNDALVSALVKFQAWCEDNRDLLADYREMEQQLKRAEKALNQIDLALRIPAAEYVPAIGDVFQMIDGYWNEREGEARD